MGQARIENNLFISNLIFFDPPFDVEPGSVDITTTDGVERRFNIGSVLKVEDVGGRGHKSKAVDNGIRKSIFLILG